MPHEAWLMISRTLIAAAANGQCRVVLAVGDRDTITRLASLDAVLIADEATLSDSRPGSGSPGRTSVDADGR